MLVAVYSGDEIKLGRMKFDVIWPERGFESKELNETAIVES